ncbi:hypothetical protein DFP83_104208 [Idiomarina fontislapidosi]|uniref:Uncharacterized protein n=1 Tax=Idiomarina fontislapidosi TaxID=263723 RepID=A0A432Y2L7_9GAMM|nr:hypothetical protein [Idiomarina fontislapidosi]PYE33368.1 hypothetical protein DFP83_104208 [Idiomarina fontislapidosi]RUO55200.1 hypothetical protein CWE25_07435 [Idiomarina fontislapidosi]
MTKSRSIRRANKTTTSLAEILAAEGIRTIVPGLSISYELGKLMFNHAKQFRQDQVESRLELFHEALLSDNVESEPSLDSKFLNKQFDIDDYHLLLESCVRDIEDEKAEVYANLMRSLIDRRIMPERRRDIIQMVRELSSYEIRLLRQGYIHSRFRMFGVQSGPDFKSVDSGGRASDRRSVNKFTYHGLTDERTGKLTKFAEELIELVFPETELLPESIGAVQASGLKVLILCYRLDDQWSLDVTEAIQQALDRMATESFPVALLKANATIGHTMHQAGILIVDDSDAFKNNVDWEAVRMFSEKRPLLRINIRDNNVDIGNARVLDEYDIVGSSKQEVRDELERLFKSLLQHDYPQAGV